MQLLNLADANTDCDLQAVLPGGCDEVPVLMQLRISAFRRADAIEFVEQLRLGER
jgi:hypothetical protein